MTGKILAGMIVVTALIAGVALYYLQVYAYYDDVEVTENPVQLTSLVSGDPESIVADSFEGIDSESSPLRYRACFTTIHSHAMLSETYVPYDDAVPLTAPKWFDCYDAVEIGEALEAGTALAYMGEADITYGFDRVIAIMEDGRGFVWHQLNECGAELFDGQPLPEGCPPPPERN